MTERRIWNGSAKVWRASGLADVPTSLPQPPNQPPTAPGGLVVSTGQSSASLTWTAASDPDGSVVGYQVFVNGAKATTVTGLSATVSGLTAATSYTFAIKAVDTAGATGPAATVTRSTLADSTPPPASVSHGFQITAANTGHTAYVDPALGRAVVDGDLTVHPSFLYISDLISSGGTLTRHSFPGGVHFDIPCTLVACKIEGSVTTTTNHLVLNWCTIDTSGAAGDYAIAYGNYDAYRCRIGGGSDGIKAGVGTTTVTECFIRTKSQSAIDHADGMQDSGGDASVTIQRCNVDCRPVNGGGGVNAALFGADACTGPHKWYDNFVAGGGYVLRLYENAHYDVQGNWCLNGSWLYGPAATAVIPASYITWGTNRPNLIVDQSGNSVSVLTQPA